jgi:hypothetical protein
MNVDAILDRRPVEAGITVLSTVNIQHLESAVASRRARHRTATDQRRRGRRGLTMTLRLPAAGTEPPGPGEGAESPAPGEGAAAADPAVLERVE